MLSGKTPFKGATEFVTFENIRHGNIKFPEDIDPLAKDLISKLLVPDPNERLGSKSGIKEIIEHPFFGPIDFENIDSMEAPHKSSSLIKLTSSFTPPPVQK